MQKQLFYYKLGEDVVFDNEDNLIILCHYYNLHIYSLIKIPFINKSYSGNNKLDIFSMSDCNRINSMIYDYENNNTILAFNDSIKIFNDKFKLTNTVNLCDCKSNHTKHNKICLNSNDQIICCHQDHNKILFINSSGEIKNEYNTDIDIFNIQTDNEDNIYIESVFGCCYKFNKDLNDKELIINKCYSHTINYYGDLFYTYNNELFLYNRDKCIKFYNTTNKIDPFMSFIFNKSNNKILFYGPFNNNLLIYEFF